MFKFGLIDELWSSYLNLQYYIYKGHKPDLLYSSLLLQKQGFSLHSLLLVQSSFTEMLSGFA